MSKLRQSFGALYRRVCRLVQGESRYRRNIFSRVYAQGEWGNESSSAFYSGIGSRGPLSEFYADQMSGILARLAASLDHPLTIVDIGCGDFEVGRALLERLPGAIYVGCDIVPALIDYNRRTFGSNRIRFEQLDLVSDSLPSGDVCLVRQVLQHLSNDNIASFLARADYPHLYVTEGQPEVSEGPVNPDKLPGAHVRFDWGSGRGRGVELSAPPFNLKVEEQFRMALPGHEIIITDRVFGKDHAQ